MRSGAKADLLGCRESIVGTQRKVYLDIQIPGNQDIFYARLQEQRGAFRYYGAASPDIQVEVEQCTVPLVKLSFLHVIVQN